ncbi:uncharacterized protein BO80DRAFT_428060 [Aspergillus ibericus CBS 121593]|uniref:Uncharacterized protein n=1 Tax=Aspergillus ibericus CBS 121593 TaxID=1448316 RepID=A0A395GS98_9EURO|nr:hypothetical protein BO80DRAFT_428060 [Aspergillus ibericus CBS 121593]RAK97587.1 hypothetical protein BO80DRAFT_428060 [Aspergillus ibericus CBS 121593]
MADQCRGYWASFVMSGWVALLDCSGVVVVGWGLVRSLLVRRRNLASPVKDVTTRGYREVGRGDRSGTHRAQSLADMWTEK